METENTDKRLWTWVSEDGKSGAAGMSLGSGGGMKIGAGHKPQPYGWHGYYGETVGGSSPGPVYRAKVTPPHEVRGKVTPPPPAPKPTPKGNVTWNSKLQPKPSADQLEPNMQEALHNVGEGRDLNVSSAYRPDERTDAQRVEGKTIDPHSDRRAVDINYVNGAHVSKVAGRGGPKEAELRQQVAEMQAKAEQDKNVQAFISPYGGFFRAPGGAPSSIPANHPVRETQKDHVHIAVFKLPQ